MIPTPTEKKCILLYNTKESRISKEYTYKNIHWKFPIDFFISIIRQSLIEIKQKFQLKSAKETKNFNCKIINHKFFVTYLKASRNIIIKGYSKRFRCQTMMNITIIIKNNTKEEVSRCFFIIFKFLIKNWFFLNLIWINYFWDKC